MGVLDQPKRMLAPDSQLDWLTLAKEALTFTRSTG